MIIQIISQLLTGDNEALLMNDSFFKNNSSAVKHKNNKLGIILQSGFIKYFLFFLL